MSIGEEEYPNQYLGLDSVQDGQLGAVNKMAMPLKFASNLGATGVNMISGVGVPGTTAAGAASSLKGTTGDLYFRQDGSTGIYRCSTSSAGATAAVWTGLV